MSLLDLELDDNDFLGLLEKIMQHNKKLQNSPPDHVPQEELAADEVLKYLEPYSGADGPLSIRKLTFTPGRSNVIIKYQGTDPKSVVSFVGCHMDVVPANPEEWTLDPFKLTRDGDKLSGRGVTDCLGHVAVVTQFFKQLAIKKPVLKNSIIGIFIANEESSSEGSIGIDELDKRGELDVLKNGPLFWIDSANFGPTLGTGGMMTWQLDVDGKKFHSGLPHKGINAIELANEAVRVIQGRFYKDFVDFAKEEKEYLFQVGSSMKPTQIKTGPGSINQIPGQCVVQGDIRFTPFYSAKQVKDRVESYVKELDLASLPVLGASRFEIDGAKGSVTLKWTGDIYQGVAVNMSSPGYKALLAAVTAARGKPAEPFSLTGSLPIIRDLADKGFDVQITGFGRMEAYHANDEYGYLSDFQAGIRVLARLVSSLDA